MGILDREAKMSGQIPINPNILKWSRETIGLSIEEVSRKTKFKTEKIQAWENGNATPTYCQLENLANNIYKRPIALYFFPEIPEEDSPKTSLRTLPDNIINNLPPEIIKIYRKAKVYELNLIELNGETNTLFSKTINNLSLNLLDNIQTKALKIREYLKITIDDQFKWDNYDFALKKWRELIENMGIFVFKAPFKNDNYSGLSIYSENYPIIIINNSLPKSRQIFTLFHELGHVLLKDGGIDFRTNEITNTFVKKYKKIELFCNKFAGQILVPDSSFRSENLSFNKKQIDEYSQKYSVSREVILRKYLDYSIINSTTYNKIVAEWKKESKNLHTTKGGGNYYLNQRVYLSDYYTKLVFKNLYQNRISENYASDYLNITPSNIQNFEQFIFE